MSGRKYKIFKRFFRENKYEFGKRQGESIEKVFINPVIAEKLKDYLQKLPAKSPLESHLQNYNQTLHFLSKLPTYWEREKR